MFWPISGENVIMDEISFTILDLTIVSNPARPLVQPSMDEGGLGMRESQRIPAFATRAAAVTMYS